MFLPLRRVRERLSSNQDVKGADHNQCTAGGLIPHTHGRPPADRYRAAPADQGVGWVWSGQRRQGADVDIANDGGRSAIDENAAYTGTANDPWVTGWIA
jgi:hypothetical protein